MAKAKRPTESFKGGHKAGHKMATVKAAPVKTKGLTRS